MQVRNTMALRCSGDVQPIRRVRRRRPRDPQRVRTVRVDRRVLAVALRLAAGDQRRLRLCQDGSVLVVNV